MSAETRDRVRRVAMELGYVANHRAHALRKSRSGAIALVVPDPNNAVFASMLRGARNAAVGRDFLIVLGEATRGTGSRDYLRALVGGARVDGILLQRPEDMGDNVLTELVSGITPLVLVNSRLPGHEGSVVLPDEEGARIATEHLIGLGHRRIAHFTGRREHDTARRRHDGFLDALHAAGLRQRMDWIIESGWEAPDGVEAMRRLLALEQSPTAVLVSSVNAAVGAVGEAARAGVRVPQDLSIATINDTWVASAIAPALTTVVMPLAELGARAADMLLDFVVSGTPPTHEVVAGAPQLVVRESTASPA